jgi:hypothetical protein
MNDLKLAIKSLGKSPAYTLIAIITLGLGIGANTSMFSILNGYTLRPAPYADRDRLDRIYRTTRQERRGGISPADYLDLKSDTSGYGEIAAYTYADTSLSAETRRDAQGSPRVLPSSSQAGARRTFRPTKRRWAIPRPRHRTGHGRIVRRRQPHHRPQGSRRQRAVRDRRRPARHFQRLAPSEWVDVFRLGQPKKRRAIAIPPG